MSDGPKIIMDDPPKSWWPGDKRVEPYMELVTQAIDRHLPKGPANTDIYNRAYEAVYKAISDYAKQDTNSIYQGRDGSAGEAHRLGKRVY